MCLIRWCASALLALLFVWPTYGQIIIDSGIDTSLPELGLFGPDVGHDTDADEEWEWDGDDAGGTNYGLLWFDIPENVVSSFGPNDFAILSLFTTNDGDAAEMHRVTVDWVSEFGREITYDDMPDGPGIVPGQNVEESFDSVFPAAGTDELSQTDVSKDLLAWAQNGQNYGWVFVPTGGNGHGINAFGSSVDAPQPTLLVGSRIATPIQRTTAPNTNQGHVWRYLDNLAEGDNPYPKDAQGDQWNAPDYDDSFWKSGPAVFGNGNLRGSDDTGGQSIDEAPEPDELPFGTVINSSASGADPRVRRETDLFRTTFNVADQTGVKGIGADILAEDGAVIYVNGVEVLRTNMPAGPVTTGTRAGTTPSTLETAYKTVVGLFSDIGRNPLVIGENTLAVELHQDRATSNDRGFDMALSLLGDPGAAPLGPELQAGDADQDLDFDQLDLVRVQIASKYLTGQPATWGDGDWNGAPGGSPGNPPTGDGVFNQLDIIAASLGGRYLQGKYAAIAPGGTENDGQTSIVYNSSTGELGVDAPSGTELTSINIDSASGIFTGDPCANLGGSFDNCGGSDNIFKATFGSSFGSLSFGKVAPTGLAQDFVLNDLTVVGSLAGGGDLGAVDLIYVPEPSAIVLLGLGFIGVLLMRRR